MAVTRQQFVQSIATSSGGSLAFGFTAYQTAIVIEASGPVYFGFGNAATSSLGTTGGFTLSSGDTQYGAFILDHPSGIDQISYMATNTGSQWRILALR